MTYALNIDQQFAEMHGLTLTQVATLAAFITLPTWTKNIAIDGHVWYMYSEIKMAEDFPLLFGIPKRCYKNINELAELGFVQLTKLGRDKYVRFTERCQDWGKEKVQNRTERPETDAKKSENGLNNSPKTDANYNINNNTNDIIDNTADGGLFAPDEVERVEKHKGTTEALCLFANSKYNGYEDFAACFTAPEFGNVDIAYYYASVADWSSRFGKKQKDWIATARSFMRRDNSKHELHLISHPAPDADYMDSAKRYLEM